MTPTYINLKFSLEFGRHNGSMSLDISNNDQQLEFLENVNDNQREFSYLISLPNKIRLKLSNKNINSDTKIDMQGNILADKYIKLIHMSLGGIPVNAVNLFKICKYTVDDQVTFNTYWGFNGLIEIEFDENNFLKWHLKSKNLFDI